MATMQTKLTSVCHKSRDFTAWDICKHIVQPGEFVGAPSHIGTVFGNKGRLTSY